MPRPWLAYFALSLLLIAFCSYAPGQATFGADEANILFRAYDANLTHRIAARGLEGSLGHPYGPAGIWFYQVLLLLTHDLLHVMRLHILLFTGAIALAGASLARTAQLNPLAFLPALASPYTWFFSRQLWDNPLNIPLGLAAFAALASFLKSSRPLALYLTILFSGLMLLVHLMAVPLVAAIAFYLLFVRSADLRRHLPVLLLGLISVGILSSQYVPAFLHDKPVDPVYINKPSLRPWFYTLLGPRVLSATHLDAFFFLFDEHVANPAGQFPNHARYLTSGGTWSTAFSALSTVTYLIYPLTWLALLCHLPGLARALGKRRSPSLAAPIQPSLWPPGTEPSALASATPALAPTPRPLTTELIYVSILTLLFQTLLFGLTRTYGQPGYYNGTFPAFLFPAALAFHHLLRRRFFAALLPAHLLCSVACSALLLYRLTQTSGLRSPEYGPALGNQLEIIQAVQATPNAFLDTHGRISWTGSLLLSFLYPSAAAAPSAPRKTFDLLYTHPADPFDAHLSLATDKASPR